MSTVSVYRDWPSKPLNEHSELLYRPPDAGPDYGTDTEDGPTRYGYQKAGCEAAAVTAFGAIGPRSCAPVSCSARVSTSAACRGGCAVWLLVGTF